MAMPYRVREFHPPTQDIEPLGYVALWQAMRRADSALTHHDLRQRLPDHLLTEEQKHDLEVAADILDPDREDPGARFTEYDAAIPPDQLVAEFQAMIDGRDVRFEDGYFDVRVRLRLTANALRRLSVGDVVEPEIMPVVSDTVSTLLQYGVDQFVD
jgi:hypothetical protein